jgi:hypothetical protein
VRLLELKEAICTKTQQSLLEGCHSICIPLAFFATAEAAKEEAEALLPVPTPQNKHAGTHGPHSEQQSRWPHVSKRNERAFCLHSAHFITLAYAAAVASRDVTSSGGPAAAEPEGQRSTWAEGSYTHTLDAAHVPELVLDSFDETVVWADEMLRMEAALELEAEAAVGWT